MRKRTVVAIVYGSIGAVLAFGIGGYVCWTYPHGYAHCCSVAMLFALQEYADAHDGRYPAGEATPEASLSLLYKEKLINPYILRGMIVPEKIVRRRRGDPRGSPVCWPE